MIRLSFQVDQNVAARDRGSDVTTMFTSDLGQALFAMPIYLEVNGVKVIRALHVPIFYIAAWGLHEIRRLGDGEEALIDLEGYGTLIITRFGDQLGFNRRTNEAPEMCGYSQALDEWTRFGRDVAQYLLTELPDLVRHAEIGQMIDDLVHGGDVMSDLPGA